MAKVLLTALVLFFPLCGLAAAQPTVSSILPAAGSFLGGTQVTITGTGFAAAATVVIGSRQATNVVVNSAGTSLTAITPSGTAGPAVDVIVANSQSEFGGLPAAFTYHMHCGTITENCFTAYLADGKAMPANIVPEVTIGDSGLQISLLNTSKPEGDFLGRYELSPTLATTSLLTIALKLASTIDDPFVAMSTGRITEWSFDASTRIATVITSPRPSSWSIDGCNPTSCAPQASVDYAAFVLLSLSPMNPPPGADPSFTTFRDAMRGSFVATNAQFFSSPSFNPATEALEFQLGAPSLRLDTTANSGSLRTLIPYAMLTDIWGVANPAAIGASETTLTVGGTPSTPTVTHVAATGSQPAGILYEVPAFGYSTPSISIKVTAPAGPAPTVALDRTALIFGATNNGIALSNQTAAQIVRLTQSGTGTVTWTASSSQPWLQVSPASGTGAADLSVSVVFSNTLPLSGASTGTITLAFTGAGNTAGPVNVTLNTLPAGTSAAPVGAFETPADGLTGVSGSIAVTGWAMDDLEVVRVRILRDPVAGEGASQIFIGNAVLVEGARSDLIPVFPTSPRNTRGGWGYLMLTNFLPNGGNGTFTLQAYADDAEGNSTLLGSKTITVDNANATKPFGAIDTPAQGETISGTNYANFGWVLSRGTTRADPPGGGTVRVVIDGAFVSSVPTGWTSRSDLAGLFPLAQYAGIGTAAGLHRFNPSLLTNGTHTIAWVVTDNLGGADGVGSRFFNVAGGVSGGVTGSSVTGGSVLGSSVLGGSESSSLAAPGMMALARSSSTLSLEEEVALAPVDTRAIQGRRGFDEQAPLRDIRADAAGRFVIHGEELDRFELDLRTLGPSDPRTLSGYMRVGEHLGPLPIGSRLDEATGAFTWMPGVGFVGSYDLVFVRWQGGQAVARQDVRFVLHPKGSNRVGPQVMIDTPSSDADVRAEATGLYIAGWAIDLDDTIGSGVSTVHSWAYPVTAVGHDAPIFLGIAAYGGHRPDVGAIFGDRFAASAYDLLAPPLPPGTYDIAVFAWSTAKHEFVPAKVVRVHVR